METEQQDAIVRETVDQILEFNLYYDPAPLSVADCDHPVPPPVMVANILEPATPTAALVFRDGKEKLEHAFLGAAEHANRLWVAVFADSEPDVLYTRYLVGHLINGTLGPWETASYEHLFPEITDYLRSIAADFSGLIHARTEAELPIRSALSRVRKKSHWHAIKHEAGNLDRASQRLHLSKVEMLEIGDALAERINIEEQRYIIDSTIALGTKIDAAYQADAYVRKRCKEPAFLGLICRLTEGLPDNDCVMAHELTRQLLSRQQSGAVQFSNRPLDFAVLAKLFINSDRSAICRHSGWL